MMDSLSNFDINDIDFSNMGSWPVAGKSAMLLIVFSIVFGLGVYLLIMDKMDDLVKIERQEVELKKEFEKKQAKAVNLDAYKRQMQTIKDSFQTLLQQLPKATQMAELLDDVSYAATGAGCEIIGLAFKGVKEAEFYSEEPIQVEVSGSYHEIADFVSRVSRLPRIVTLHDFTLSVGQGSVKNNVKIADGEEAFNEKVLILNVMAKTYRADSGGK